VIDQSRNNAEYQAIIKTAVDGIIVIDELNTTQSFNPAAERMFGYSPVEVIGRNITMLIPQFVQIKGVDQAVEGRKKDGSLFPVDLSIAEWWSEGRRFSTGIMRDVTERIHVEQEMHRTQEELEGLNRHLEERVLNEVAERETAQLRALRAERIQALGQLAGGIAHDFNNVLQTMSGAADLLHSEKLRIEHVTRIADTIAKAAQRGTMVTERLLAFARRSPLQPAPLNVAETLNDIGRLLAQTLGSSITVRVDVEADLEPLMVDGGQLETVLINIGTNARDAMPNGGVFTLSAKRVLVGGGQDAEPSGLNQGRYVKIAGSDTGTGMDEATVIRAPEPFFTTKVLGKGTGLGLSMAKGFAEQSGGGLIIESRSGHGTTVSVCLPETNRASEKLHKRSDDRTGQRILLVDDDELIRDILEQQLTNAGYAISLAADGVEAFATFAAEGADLILTDFSMPGMNGVKLIAKLQERVPNLPAILITGYTTEQVAWRPDSPFRLLHKPVSQARLYQEVSSCLASTNCIEHGS
jgi:PAS domain S-box-containing protein